jgi:hypothetical protein
LHESQSDRSELKRPNAINDAAAGHSGTAGFGHLMIFDAISTHRDTTCAAGVDHLSQILRNIGVITRRGLPTDCRVKAVGAAVSAVQKICFVLVVDEAGAS